MEGGGLRPPPRMVSMVNLALALKMALKTCLVVIFARLFKLTKKNKKCNRNHLAAGVKIRIVECFTLFYYGDFI